MWSSGTAGAEEEWEWPEEKPITSTYYVKNKVVPGEAPAPMPQPKMIARSGGDAGSSDASVTVVPPPPPRDPSKEQHTVRNYSWSDDIDVIRVIALLLSPRDARLMRAPV